MNRKIVSAITLTLLLGGILTLAFDIQTVRGSGGIYIRADGSIDPPTAPISTIDNVTYTFADNINDAIFVERNNIVIDGDGYTLNGGGVVVPRGSGIYLSGQRNVTVRDTYIENFIDGGIDIRGGSSNNISGNNIVGNVYGVLFDSSSNNSICGNNIASNSNGIWLWSSSNHNSICGNNITANAPYGIWLGDSFSNSICGNTITNNNYGIGLSTSSNNSICGNDIANSGYHGVFLSHLSNYNSISENNITVNSYYGIYLAECSNNSICENIITDNDYGVRLYGAFDNTIYHNNFDNIQQVNVTLSGPNVWDDGYPSGGNYWGNYNETDANLDGVGDTAYIIDANNTDHYPLMIPYIIPEFPSLIILPLFFITMLLAVVVPRRKK